MDDLTRDNESPAVHSHNLSCSEMTYSATLTLLTTKRMTPLLQHRRVTMNNLMIIVKKLHSLKWFVRTTVATWHN